MRCRSSSTSERVRGKSVGVRPRPIRCSARGRGVARKSLPDPFGRGRASDRLEQHCACRARGVGRVARHNNSLWFARKGSPRGLKCDRCAIGGMPHGAPKSAFTGRLSGCSLGVSKIPRAHNAPRLQRLLPKIRRGWDSKPQAPCNANSSRLPRSTTPAPLRGLSKPNPSGGSLQGNRARTGGGRRWRLTISWLLRRQLTRRGLRLSE